MNQAGTVEQTGSKPVKTRFGVKNTYSFKVNGQWFKTGFKDPKVNVGDEVKFDYNPGTYGNEVVEGSLEHGGSAVAPAASAPAAAAAPAPRAPTGRAGAFPIPPLDGQRAIVRQNAITNAREMVLSVAGGEADKGTMWKDTQNRLDTLSAEVIRIARKFEEYACGDDAMAAAKASLEATKH